MSVPVSVVLERKGRRVATIAPGASLAEAAHELAHHDVGALVVAPDGATIEGIISERDLARALARLGSACGDEPVRAVMVDEVVTCSPDTSVDDLTALMTHRRVRHVPVVEAGVLVGIVSIGDVVKSRMDELELEAESLATYVSGGG